MSRPEGFDDAVSDPYTSEASGDIYNTPDVVGERQNGKTAEITETGETTRLRENAESEDMSTPAGVTESAVQQSEDAPETGLSEAEVCLDEQAVDINPADGVQDESATESAMEEAAQDVSGRQTEEDNSYNNSPYNGSLYGGQFSQGGSPYNNNPDGGQYSQGVCNKNKRPQGGKD